MKFSFLNTIRFKLAATYAAVIFVCFAAFLLLFNVYMRSYFLQPLDQEAPVVNITGRPIVVDVFRKLQKAEQQRILEIRQQDFRLIQTISVISLVPIAAISIAAAYFLTEEYLNPLNILNKKIAARTTENLGEQIDYSGPDDEVGQIINSFNQMASRLHGDFEMQSQFIQDASHELKTPLAVLQSNIELVLDNFDQKSLEHKSLSNALTGVTRLNTLLDDLLTLSHSSDHSDDINLNSLISELKDDLQELANSANTKLTIDLPPKNISFTGSYNDFYRAVRNIVENGIKYSQEEDTPIVNIRLSKNKNSIKIEIKDNGPGIPVKAQKLIFDRFYRVDKSRSTKAGGNGLGLSIAKKILTEHGWDISLASQPGNTTFTLSN